MTASPEVLRQRPTAERNRDIRRRAAGGETFSEIAADYGISRQRAEQIAQPHRHDARQRAQDITIPEGTVCQRCVEREAEERHHPDYSVADYVELLCRRCHRLADREAFEVRGCAELGLRPDVSLETIQEAAERAGLSLERVREAVTIGAIRAARQGTHAFLIPGEVDAWAAFVSARNDVHAEVNGNTECHRGHLMAHWNLRTAKGSGTPCRACNSENVQVSINGGRVTDNATQYDVCEALHHAGYRILTARHARIETVHPAGGLFYITRGGTTRWIVRFRGCQELGRSSTAGGVLGIIQHAVSQSRNGDDPC